MAPKSMYGGEHDYKQSYTQKMFAATVVISLDHKNKINILKSRYVPAQEDISTQHTINILTEILVRNIFGDYMDLFRESLKSELKKAIIQTIEGGVAKCEPHSMNEQLEWVSNP